MSLIAGENRFGGIGGVVPSLLPQGRHGRTERLFGHLPSLPLHARYQVVDALRALEPERFEDEGASLGGGVVDQNRRFGARRGARPAPLLEERSSVGERLTRLSEGRLAVSGAPDPDTRIHHQFECAVKDRIECKRDTGLCEHVIVVPVGPSLIGGQQMGRSPGLPLLDLVYAPSLSNHAVEGFLNDSRIGLQGHE
jgi:hypothetical protein